MKKKLFLLSSILLATQLYGNGCEREFSKYPELKKDGWSIRVDTQIDLYGCKVVPIFHLLVDIDAIEIMDAVDENPSMMRDIIKVFEHKEILEIIYSNLSLKELVIGNLTNPLFLQNFNYLIDYNYNSAHRKKILTNPIYFNHYLFPAINAKNRTELKKDFNALKRLDIQELKFFSFLYSIIGSEYSFSLLVENFTTLKDKFSKYQLEKIISYPKYIAYFLYPSKEELEFFGSSKELYRKQQKYQELSISLYKNLYKYFVVKLGSKDANELALVTLENIYPYIIKNHNQYYEIDKLFQLLVKNGFIENLWNELNNNMCNKQSQQEIFALFGDNNIKNLLSFQENENDIYKHLLYSSSKEKNIQSIFYMANVYAKFDKKRWKVFKDLLITLPTPTKDIYQNSFVLKELDKMGYFKKIVKYSNYNYFIEKDEDVSSGTSSKKYKFILLTSYPSDNDPSVFDFIGANQIVQAEKNLDILYNKSIDELETHNFTAFEKSMAFLNKADWVLTGASIGLAPFTGGMSLSYLATKTVGKQTGKYAVKKGLKYYSKKIFRGTMKLANKSIRHIRVARGTVFKSFGEKSSRNFGIHLDRSSSHLDNIMIGMTLGALGASYFVIPRSIEAKDICKGVKK